MGGCRKVLCQWRRGFVALLHLVGRRRYSPGEALARLSRERDELRGRLSRLDRLLGELRGMLAEEAGELRTQSRSEGCKRSALS